MDLWYSLLYSILYNKCTTNGSKWSLGLTSTWESMAGWLGRVCWLLVEASTDGHVDCLSERRARLTDVFPRRVSTHCSLLLDCTQLRQLQRHEPSVSAARHHPASLSRNHGYTYRPVRRVQQTVASIIPSYTAQTSSPNLTIPLIPVKHYASSPYHTCSCSRSKGKPILICCQLSGLRLQLR